MLRKKNTTGIPDFEIDSLAKTLLPMMRAYLDSEDGQKEFKAWQGERQQKQLNRRLNNEKESH